jgi:hypothetical protein
MEGRVGVVVTGELEEIVVMTDGLMTRTPKKLCDLLDVEDWLALYHVRSPALSLGVICIAYISRREYKITTDSYMETILSHDPVTTEYDSRSRF